VTVLTISDDFLEVLEEKAKKASFEPWFKSVADDLHESGAEGGEFYREAADFLVLARPDVVLSLLEQLRLHKSALSELAMLAVENGLECRRSGMMSKRDMACFFECVGTERALKKADWW